MDLKDLEGLKEGIGDLVKNVKAEDIDKIKELVKDGVDADKIKELIKDGVDVDKIKELVKDGVENSDELKDKV